MLIRFICDVTINLLESHSTKVTNLVKGTENIETISTDYFKDFEFDQEEDSLIKYIEILILYGQLNYLLNLNLVLVTKN